MPSTRPNATLAGHTSLATFGEGSCQKIPLIRIKNRNYTCLLVPSLATRLGRFDGAAQLSPRLHCHLARALLRLSYAAKIRDWAYTS